jgi:hypothetical protein
MSALICKEDFAAFNLVKFSQNIFDDQIEPYIYAAQEYDLEPVLGVELYEAIKKTVLTPELKTFLNTKVKRFLVLVSYRRFISAHGMNITQFGLTKTNDPQNTFEQASSTERAIIIRQIDSDANTALIKMTSVPFIFDGISYEKGEGVSKPSVSIRAPKRKQIVNNTFNNGIY